MVPESTPSQFLLGAEVNDAFAMRRPVVALESALVTHGLPYPRNLELVREMETVVRSEGATPATIAVIAGRIRVGLTDNELAALAESDSNLKIGPRDFPKAIVEHASGGTTVAATMFVAARVGTRVFATGGIGGVHRESQFDVSADLRTLADTRMIVVCAGAKAILDLEATLEYLETMGVPVIGYGTDELPAFYSRESGLHAGVRRDSPQEIVEYWNVHQALGLSGAILVVNPVPSASAIPRSEIEPLIAQATQEARERKVQGQLLTPFLLERLRELTGGRSVHANEALLLNNARLAAQIAKTLAVVDMRKES